MATITNPLAGRQRVHRGKKEDLGLENRRLFGDFIAERRMARGLTQLDLGKALGMSNSAVSAIELGRNSLPPERYRDTADALGMNRKQFGKVVLRYYNPWLMALLYPEEMSAQAVKRLPERLRDFRLEESNEAKQG